MSQPDNRPNGNRPNGTQEPNFNWRGLVLFAIAITLLAGAFVFRGPISNTTEVPYPELLKLLDDKKIITDNKEFPIKLISTASSANPVLVGFRRPESPSARPERFRTPINLLYLQDNLYWELQKRGVSPIQEEDSNLLASAIFSFLPILLFLLILYFLFRQQIRMAGKGALNFGKSKARMLSREKNK
ncbi:MAG TPA: hypothetical protein VFG14_19160, partial [Chthoniobacteraceae bacterium]|nr:hypothetical protein [Chthoniobacteraceae bacterium]